MSKTLIFGITLIILAVSASVAAAHYQVFQPDDSFAQVIRVTPLLDANRNRTVFEVAYRWRDQTGIVHMDFAPGERIPVKDGRLVSDP